MLPVLQYNRPQLSFQSKDLGKSYFQKMVWWRRLGWLQWLKFAVDPWCTCMLKHGVLGGGVLSKWTTDQWSSIIPNSIQTSLPFWCAATSSGAGLSSEMTWSAADIVDVFVSALLCCSCDHLKVALKSEMWNLVLLHLLLISHKTTVFTSANRSTSAVPNQPLFPLIAPENSL